MKIAHVSDLHLDFNTLNAASLLEEADYLFIAGDTIESKWFEFAMRPASSKHLEALKLVDFFSDLGKHYKSVHMIMGNHEHYYGSIMDTLDTIRDFLRLYNIENVFIHENDVFYLEGKKVLAGTGWTDMGGPNNYWFVKTAMNDFRLIRGNKYSKFKPEDAVKLHNAFLHKFVVEKPDLVLMHHAPSIFSIEDRFKADPVSAAYWSKTMERLLDSWTEPLVIFHGHTHNAVDYVLNGFVRVTSNPRGYYNGEYTAEVIYV